MSAPEVLDVPKLLERYMRDARAWRLECIRIRSKDGPIVPYADSPARRDVRRHLRSPGHHSVLKARQVGVSTEILLGALHRCQFRDGTTVALTAHTLDAAKSLMRLCISLYYSQPDHIRLHCALVGKPSKLGMEFANGSRIIANTAYSESWRSQTYDYLHLSEVAHYTDYEGTVRALLQTASPNAVIMYETTPNGPNEFHAAWSDPQVRWNRIFISWLDSPEYQTDEEPDWAVTPQELEYIQEHKLSPARANWFRKILATKCNNNLDTFRQEYPSDPESCFLLSGKRFFHCVFQDVEFTPEQAKVVMYAKPQLGHRYGVGIDGASGSPTGDASSLTIVDCTTLPHKIVLRYTDRLPPNQWAENAAKLIRPYTTRAVLVESNHVGVAIAETLTKAGIRCLRKDGRLLWCTDKRSRPLLLSNLHRAISKGLLLVNDPFTAAECNTFVYNKKGRPEAASGKCDDAVFSLGLAEFATKYVPQVKQADVEWAAETDVHAAIRADIRRFTRMGTAAFDPQQGEFSGI